MKVIQLLPALNSGGVERGTLDLAKALVDAGHESLVVSNGGKLVARLEQEGSRHIAMPVHKKSLLSLLQVRPLRRLIERERPDILHVRSRMPAWITYLAWKKMPSQHRPRLVSTAHGLYSINRYSAIMARSEQTIAISQYVRDYLLENYSRELKNPPELIYRGVDTQEFNPDLELPGDWRTRIEEEFPGLRGKRWLLLPARLTRWKGQADFIRLMAQLRATHQDVHGIILGGAETNKQHYAEELYQLAATLGVKDAVTFTGQRSDIRCWYRESSLVYNLSQRPEPFGRTVIEAVAMGIPVIGYDLAGPAESLRTCFPQGLVPHGDADQLYRKTCELLDNPGRPTLLPEFTLEAQAGHTLAVYQSLLTPSE